MAGYSGTPLAQKLGIRPGMQVVPVHAPSAYDSMVLPWPPGVSIRSDMTNATDLIHLFTTDRVELAEQLTRATRVLRPDAVIWVSWPKKASKVPTTVNEDTIRELALPMGLVDIKVCAVDEVWSGLKLVVRKALRAQTSSSTSSP